MTSSTATPATAPPALDFPDEVTTVALVRYVDLPGINGPVALITLDNGHDHTRPNTFGPRGLASLDAAMDEIAAHRPGVAAIAVTGKPFVFSVGADLSFRSSITDPARIRPLIFELGRLGHRVLRRVGSGDVGEGRRVPTFALVNGAAMGGGLELALHCDYRALSRDAAAIALPEVALGLVPAWGGTQLLPDLIGPEAAVTVIVENPLNQNRMVKPAQAASLGLVDLLLDPADFLEESLRWAGRVLRGEIDPAASRRDVAADRGEAWAAAVARGRQLADARVHGAAPSPYRALDLVALAETVSRDDGFAAEDTVLADLGASEELQASLYAFDLVQRRAKRPVGGPDPSLARPVTKVGVVGAGLMAAQIGLLFAQRLEVPVVLTDLDQERLDRGVAHVHGEVDNLLLRGRLGPDRATRLKALVTGSLTKDAFADADLVIEAVFEDMKVKQQVLAEIEAVVSPEALLLTNTSALSVSEMASALRHPERVAGLHFFNPVAVMPLVEVVRAAQTDDPSVATTLAVAKKLRKNAVLVADAPAFVVNRLLTRFMGEVLSALETGTPVRVADTALEPLGLPMSPLVLLSLVGPPVALHVARIMHEAFPERFPDPAGLARMVAAGKTSVYGPDGSVDEDAAALVFGSAGRESGGADSGGGGSAAGPLTAEQVRAKALAALAGEIRLLLDEKVVSDPADVDLCMILGAGWPFHLGGITPYLDRSGVSERATGARFARRGVATLP